MYFEIRQDVRWRMGVGFVLVGLFAGSSLANLYDFACITNYKTANAAIGENQLSVDVTSYGSNQAMFTFQNAGLLDSQITAVYFDDGSLLGISQLIDSDEGGGNSGVDFSQGASPSNLQGGDPVGFVATVGFSADADSPASDDWGVDPGEYLKVIFDLQSGQTFADVLNELASGALRIGVYVEDFSEGGHESFVNAVPVPAGVVLGILGFAVAGWKLRRFV